jgi:hypothetical protein
MEKTFKFELFQKAIEEKGIGVSDFILAILGLGMIEALRNDLIDVKISRAVLFNMMTYTGIYTAGCDMEIANLYKASGQLGDLKSGIPLEYMPEILKIKSGLSNFIVEKIEEIDIFDTWISINAPKKVDKLPFEIDEEA